MGEATEADRIGEVVSEMYASISGRAGGRDWSKLTVLLHPACRHMRTVLDPANGPMLKIMPTSDYIDDVAPLFAATDFYEVETGSRIDVFGDVAHVWSAYEARHDPTSERHEFGGVNSIQLSKNGTSGWRIISILWQNEYAAATEPSGS